MYYIHVGNQVDGPYSLKRAMAEARIYRAMGYKKVVVVKG